MKVIAALLATLSVAAAFAPQSVGSRSNTELSATFWDQVFGMNLFDEKQNKYGARKAKNLKVGNIGSNSYVPAGLTAEEYKKVRAKDAAKREANYQKNVAKAGKFTDFTEWYSKRGTDESGKWLNAPGRGHTFAKLKYSDNDGKKYDGVGSIFGK